MSWKAHIEWLVEDTASGDTVESLNHQIVTGTGSTIVISNATPKSIKNITARVTAISGACLFSTDGQLGQTYLSAGESTDIRVGTGQHISFIEADGASQINKVTIVDAGGNPLDPSATTKVVLPETDPLPLLNLNVLNGSSGPIDMSGYGCLSFNVSAIGTLVVTVYDSEDGVTNWNPVGIITHSSPSGTGVITQFSTTGAWTIPRRGKYIQFVVTNFTSGSVTAQYTKHNFIATVTAAVAHGANAHSSPSTGNPLKNGGVVATSTDTTLAHGDAAQDVHTKSGAKLVTLDAIFENKWSRDVGIINNTVDHEVKAAVSASFKNVITGITLSYDALTSATELVCRESAAGNNGTVLWMQKLPINETSKPYHLPCWIVGSANKGLSFATITAAGESKAIYITAHGHIEVA